MNISQAIALEKKKIYMLGCQDNLVSISKKCLWPMLFTNLQTENIKYKTEHSYKQKTFYYLELILGISK